MMEKYKVFGACQQCGNLGALRYNVNHLEGEYKLDLCPACAQPLEAMLERYELLFPHGKADPGEPEPDRRSRKAYPRASQPPARILRPLDDWVPPSPAV